MNGIGLLVLIAAAGQLGANQPRLSNNFGWDFDNQNPDHALCFIVQVSPQQAEEMQRNDSEFPSSMPPELVGRATRILVRIGTDPLPQNPTLEELRKMPRVNSAADVTAGLGGGRISDVEPDSLITVQQDRSGSPSLPAFPNQGLTSPSLNSSSPISSLADHLPKGSENLADQVKSLVPGTPGFPNASAAGAAPIIPDFGSSAAADRFGNSSVNSNPIAPRTDGRSNAAGNDFAGQDDYDPRVPPSLATNMQTSVPNLQTPSNGFGTYNGNQAPNKFGIPTPGLDNSSGQLPYSQNQFSQAGQGMGGQGMGGQGMNYSAAPSGQGNSPFGPSGGYNGMLPANGQFVGNGGGSGYDPSSRIAANDVGGSLLPLDNRQSQGSAMGGTGTVATQVGNAHSPNDGNGISSGEAASAKPKTFDNILSVILLLSLLVNGYLGALIRKLLTRYRTLLANMRGQSVPNTFGA